MRLVARAVYSGDSATLFREADPTLPIRFVDKVINCFTDKGNIEPAVRCEAAFTDISGLVGVFSEGNALKILEVIRDTQRGQFIYSWVLMTLKPLTSKRFRRFYPEKCLLRLFTSLFVPENGVARKGLECSCA